MRPVVASELKTIKSSIDYDIEQAFTSKRHVSIARDANEIMHDILSQPPIGWNIGTTQREYLDNCYKVVHDEYLRQHPPGFLGTWLFGTIISSVIAWIIRRWLDHIFMD